MSNAERIYVKKYLKSNSDTLCYYPTHMNIPKSKTKSYYNGKRNTSFYFPLFPKKLLDSKKRIHKTFDIPNIPKVEGDNM